MHSDQLHTIRYTNQADNPSAPSYQEVLESWEQHHAPQGSYWQMPSYDGWKMYSILLLNLELSEGESIYLRMKGDCGGRGSLSNVPYTVNKPIMLHRKHCINTLILQEAHEHIYHDGIRKTFTEIQRKYWIPVSEVRQKNSSKIVLYAVSMKVCHTTTNTAIYPCFPSEIKPSIHIYWCGFC